MKALRFLRALPLTLLMLCAPARAEQGTIIGPIAGPKTMTEVMTILNAAHLAIQSCNSGTSAPTNGVSGLPTSNQCWADTTSNPIVYKRYDGGSWVAFGKLNTSTHIWTPVYQGTDLSTASVATMGTAGHSVPFLDGANTWSAVQSFNSGMLGLKGSSSGLGTLNAPAAASAYTWTLPAATGTLADLALAQTFTNKNINCANNSCTVRLPNDVSGTLQAANFPALTGDVTTVAGALATTINPNKVVDSMLRQSAALALVGRSANSTGNVADITAVAGSSCAFRESGSTIGCGMLATAAYAANSITNAKLAQMANATTKCRTTAGTGDPEDCTGAQMRSLMSVVIGTNTQAWDADLDCLAAIGTNGIVARTGAGTCAVRTVTAPAAGISVSNGDGVAGNPTLALSNDLAALEALAGTGFSTRIAADSWAQRAIAGTANQIAVTNGDGVSGNPVISIPSNAALPGAPTTTTPAANDNSTKIATTSYVDTADALKTNVSNGLHTGVTDNQGTLKLASFVTATQLTASVNDYTATDGSNTCSTKTSLRISTNASRNITGLSCGQAEGDIRIIHNVGAFAAVLTNQDGASTAANRFLFGGDMTLAADTSVTIKYDGVASRWRAITTPGAGGGGGGVTSVGIVGAGLTANSGTCTVTTSGTCTLTTTAATQSDQEAAASNSAAVTPGRQQFHPSSVKAWVKFINIGGTGAQSISGSYNVTSVVRNSTGNYTVNFVTAFSSTDYVCSITPAGGGNVYANYASANVGSVQATFFLSGSAADPGSASVLCVGDQ